MDRLQFSGKYSFKNITTPGKEEYTKQLVHSMEQVLRRMRWRAHYFLQLGESDDRNNESGEENENDIDDEDTENRKFSSIFRSRHLSKIWQNLKKNSWTYPKNLNFDSATTDSKEK